MEDRTGGSKLSRKKYMNMDDIRNDKTIWDMIKWFRERRRINKDLDTQISQIVNNDVKRIKGNSESFSITWIGHATFLIQLNGLTILTDPVWSKQLGMQKRSTPPGLKLEELPDIDIVLISHGHYDHLSFSTIKRLPGKPLFYVPIGLKSAFTRRGYTHVTDANWWDRFQLEQLELSFVPAQHWSKRTLMDSNTSHWGGWVIEGTSRNIYFAGDSGYFRGFTQIAEQFSMDIILMPIGAYEPEWFMNVSHMNPEHAIRAFLDLKGNVMIPMHYGAFRLGDDTGPEALNRFKKEWERLKLDDRSMKILAIGETWWGN